MGWRPIATAREFETILTIHEDDLYPVCAFFVREVGGQVTWLREVEGPEDIERPGAHQPLYRAPTHWQPVPDGPANTGDPHD